MNKSKHGLWVDTMSADPMDEKVFGLHKYMIFLWPNKRGDEGGWGGLSVIEVNTWYTQECGVAFTFTSRKLQNEGVCNFADLLGIKTHHTHCLLVRFSPIKDAFCIKHTVPGASKSRYVWLSAKTIQCCSSLIESVYHSDLIPASINHGIMYNRFKVKSNRVPDVARACPRLLVLEHFQNLVIAVLLKMQRLKLGDACQKMLWTYDGGWRVDESSYIIICRSLHLIFPYQYWWPIAAFLQYISSIGTHIIFY